MNDRSDGEQVWILFIDEDSTGREVAAYQLQQAGFEVDLASDGEAGLGIFDTDRHGVVVTDLKMPEVGGMEVLQEIRVRAPEVPRPVITAFGSMEVGVDRGNISAAARVLGGPRHILDHRVENLGILLDG